MLRYCIATFFLLTLVSAFDKYPKQFVFELPDNEDFCFFEVFDNASFKDLFTIDYRVIRGGNNDVDFTITGPNNKQVYSKQKQNHDEFKTKFSSGTYSFCFGNQFSTISHKQIFFSLNRDRPETLAEEAGGSKVATVDSLLQTKMETIHEYLARVELTQSIYRARESEGRMLSEDINDRVTLLSIGLGAAIVICGFGQVFILRQFFTDREKVQYPRYATTKA